MNTIASSTPELDRFEHAAPSTLQASVGPGDDNDAVSEAEEESEEMEDSNRVIEDEPETKR